MPSFSNSVSGTQQAGNIPVGGTPFSLMSGLSYAVPAGMTLVITQIMQTSNPAVSGDSSIYGSVFYVNQNPVAVFNPSEQRITTSLSTGYDIYPQTLPLNLIFSENQSFSFSGILQNNDGNAAPTRIPVGCLSGYLIKNEAAKKDEIDFLEVERSLWAQGILNPIKSRSTEAPANVVFLGDDTSGVTATHRFALILPDNVLDRNAYVLNIETGAQTSVYTGIEKFNFNGYGGLMACWDSNYNGTGKTKLRIIAHPHSAHNKLVSNNILLISVTKDASSVVEDDFKVESLATKIPRLNSVMSLTSADGTYNVVLGFAGSDHVVIARPSAVANQAKLASYNISGTLTTQTAVTTTTFTLSNVINSKTRDTYGFYNDIYQYSPISQVTAIRGIQGKLYVSCPHTSTTATVTGNFVAVFNKNGTIATQTLTTYTSTLTVPTSFQTWGNYIFLNASKPTVGLNSAASGAERLAFYVSGVNDTVRIDYNNTVLNSYVYRLPVIGNYSFTSASVPTLTQVPPTASTSTTAVSFQTNFPSTATLVAPANLTFNSWWASRLATPYYKYKSPSVVEPLSTEEFYNQPDLWHNSINQWLRTTGILTGTVNHFYVPDGIFVQRRTLTNLGSLSASPVLSTAIANPVAAYCSANYVLVVGVDGTWERISEV